MTDRMAALGTLTSTTVPERSAALERFLSSAIATTR